MTEHPKQMEICEMSPDGQQVYVRIRFADGAVIEGWHEARQMMAKAAEQRANKGCDELAS